jgi:two-component system, response regulator
MTTEPVELLLVEDDPNDVELTLHVFRKHHLANSIHVARDGAEALDFLFGGDTSRPGRTASPGGAALDRGAGPLPKLVLLDLKLPKVDGIEVLRRLRADERTRTIPVVVLTSSQDDRDLVESYQLGVNSYVVKPVDFGQFAQCAQTLGLYWLLMNHSPPVTGGVS